MEKAGLNGNLETPFKMKLTLNHNQISKDAFDGDLAYTITGTFNGANSYNSIDGIVVPPAPVAEATTPGQVN